MSDLHSTAKSFLEDPEIRDSPRERKIDFLLSKGFTEDQVGKLLQENPPASSPSPVNARSNSSSPPLPKRSASDYYETQENFWLGSIIGTIVTSGLVYWFKVDTKLPLLNDLIFFRIVQL